MSQPGTSDVHVDAALSAISQSYRNLGYIALDLFPVVMSEKQSDKYYTFDKADLLRDEAAIRAPGDLAVRGGYRVSSTAYFCDNYAFAKQTPDETIENADEALEIDQADTEFVTDKVDLKLEVTLAAAAFVTGVWGTTTTPGTTWDDATSNPIGEIRIGTETVLKNTGVKPNTLAIGAEVWTDLQDHPDFVDRLSTQTTRILQLQAAAQIVGVDRILVGEATKNSAGEGETFSGGFVWGKHALLAHIPPSPGKRTPAAGYTFRWGSRKMLRYRDAPEGKMADVIECHDYIDFVLTGTDLGYFFLNCVA